MHLHGSLRHATRHMAELLAVLMLVRFHDKLWCTCAWDCTLSMRVFSVGCLHTCMRVVLCMRVGGS